LQATISSRNRGNGCPYCSGRFVIKGENDLTTLNPALATEWSYAKNDSLLPEHYTPNSHQKVWWKCSKGHEWQATIRDRNIGHNCPICSGNKVLKGFNDLQTVNPTLANEWDHEKNGNLKPENLTPSSNKKVWWKCINGHEWQATINNRSKGVGCPYCSGRYVIKGKTDLQTVNATLAKEWDYEMNIGLTPMDVSPNSNKKVWWKCLREHHWMATIADRNNGRGCPYCSGRYAVVGETDLQTVNPSLANEWNYEKNIGLTPMGVKPNSHRKVWWKCSNGHEWQAKIDNRSKGHGCPICARKKRK
jgi:DNA-directed RNA polymerase subunit RPC12/RpoP